MFLEARSQSEVQRNSLVSGKLARKRTLLESDSPRLAVFLRALEYQSGILMLTTNRIVSFAGLVIGNVLNSHVHSNTSTLPSSREYRSLFGKFTVLMAVSRRAARAHRCISSRYPDLDQVKRKQVWIKFLLMAGCDVEGATPKAISEPGRITNGTGTPKAFISKKQL